MAKVGRAARVASRQRVETLSGAKTIGSAETGELYLVTAASTVTLPAAQDGAYFKFVFGADVTSASALVILTSPVDTMMAGCIRIHVEGSTGAATDFAAAAQAATGDNHDKLTIGDAAKIVHPGSTVECFSDGTNWYVTGFIWAEHADVTAVFGDQ